MSATHNIPVTDKVMSAPDKVMSAPDNLLYEYAIIRYVPRIDRHEFVNVGLLMMWSANQLLTVWFQLMKRYSEPSEPRWML